MPTAQAGYIEDDRASVSRPDLIPRLPRYTVALPIPRHRGRAAQQLELADRRCPETALYITIYFWTHPPLPWVYVSGTWKPWYDDYVSYWAVLWVERS